MAKKKVAAVVKIQIPAGAATPAPPVGTALGPHGVAIMDFCKDYNAATPIPARHHRARRDHRLRGSFVHLHPQDPPTSVLIKQAAGLDKGATAAGRETAGSITEGAGGRDRPDQAARPQRQRPGRGQAPGGRHGPVHGHHRRLIHRRGTDPVRRHDVPPVTRKHLVRARSPRTHPGA